MAALLQDAGAFNPNLVQTIEGGPALASAGGRSATSPTAATA